LSRLYKGGYDLHSSVRAVSGWETVM